MSKPYVVRISSQKGGVGKTTVATNLAVALKLFRYKVLLVDADLANPSIGFHLGLSDVNLGYKHVLTGKSHIKNVITIHAPTGLHVIPGVLSGTDFIPTSEQLRKIGEGFRSMNYDFILVDTSPGLFVYGPNVNLYDEALILTTPDMSSCTSCIRLSHMYNKYKLKNHLVVNRIKNRKYEISLDEIEELFGERAVGAFPEDEIVPISIAEHIPAYLLNRRAEFSRRIADLSGLYGPKAGPEITEQGGGIWAFIKRLLGLK